MFEKEELEIIKEDCLGTLESCHHGEVPEHYNEVNEIVEAFLIDESVSNFDLEPKEVVIRQVILKKIKESP